MAEKNLKVKSEKIKVDSSSEKNKKVQAKNSPLERKEAKVVAPAKKLNATLTVDMFNNKGEKTGTFDLPEELFGQKINKVLLAQYLRIYLTNQRQGTANTKTRGQVDGSTRKIYRQKGTGRARHGGIRAPIFVKGGVAHGPKAQNYELKLNKKMRLKAFTSALSQKAKDGGIVMVEGVDSISAKTRDFAQMFGKLGINEKKRSLLLTLPKSNEKVYKAARNLEGVKIISANLVNVFEILKHKNLVLSKEAVAAFTERIKNTK